MKAAYLLGPGTLEIRETDIPSPGEEDILVKVVFCGVCTLEQRIYRGTRRMPFPVIPGHEVSGVIAGVGKQVKGIYKEGDRVSVDRVIRCRECRMCRTGHSNLCGRAHQGGRVLGGFSEYLLASPSQVYLLPDNADLKEAALTEPLACTLHSIAQVNVAPSEDVLILGAGPMGLLHVFAARKRGARVIIADPDGQRRQAALSFGASEAHDPGEKGFIKALKEFTGGWGAAAVFLTTPAPRAFEDAIALLAPAGRLNIYTSYDVSPEIRLDLNRIHRNEWVITGTEGRLPEDFLAAMRLIDQNPGAFLPLISEIYPLDDVKTALERSLAPETLRVLIEMEGMT